MSPRCPSRCHEPMTDLLRVVVSWPARASARRPPRPWRLELCSKPSQEEKRLMMSGADINSVKDLLPLLYKVPVTYIFEKKNARLEGFVTDGGYACSCPASDSCGYRGKVLSALQFEKHAGAESKNQNGHIFLRNGKSLYLLFQELRDVPAEAFAEEFLAAAGVPMTVRAAEASPAPLKQQALALASLDWDQEPNGVQVVGFSAEPNLAPAPALGNVEMLTEEEKARASFSMLGLRESSCTIQLDPMLGVERPAAEQIKDAAGCDHVMPDVKEINNEPGQPSSQVSAAGEMIYCLKDCLKESASSNLNWSASKRRSGRTFIRGTVTSTPSFSGSPDRGVCGLSTDTSKKEGSEGTCSENKRVPLSYDDLKSDSPVPIAVTPKYSKNDSTNLALSLSKQLTIAQGALTNCSINSKSKELKTRDTTLHPLIFKEGGLPDNTLLTYMLKNGEALKQGYKRGTGIVCNCCDQEFTPSHFEEHAGMGKRRQPYHNIYTSEGLTLHKLALQLQDHLNSNGFGNASVSSFSDYPNDTSSGGCKEPSTTTGPIVPLKRILQERVVETESCYFCGYGHTTLENMHPHMIIFCNQCERPCHVQCYNDSSPRKKAPLEIFKEYLCFRFMCCQECQTLRSHLQGIENCVDIASPGQIRSRTCLWLLSGMDASRDVKFYMPQVIDIFKDAFVGSTDEHSDIFSDMAYGKNGKGENDFRGMYCALLTASSRVVSAALLKVRMKQIAELVLVATRSDCRKKGYFLLLLKSIEALLRTLNVTVLTAPVDPEMAQIWSDKLGFTILSAEEKKSMLESHPLVMFKNLVLVQKSLA